MLFRFTKRLLNTKKEAHVVFYGRLRLVDLNNKSLFDERLNGERKVLG